jgi:hypothetical protein
MEATASLPLSINETQSERSVVGETGVDASTQGASASGFVVPTGVYLEPDDEGELGGQGEKGETVSLPLNKLGLFDIYIATDAQTFNPNDYHPLLEGRLSKDEFVDFISRLNQVQHASPLPLYTARPHRDRLLH